MHIQVGDRLSYAGSDYSVRSIARYQLPEGEFRLCELACGDTTVYLLPPKSPMHDRAVLLAPLTSLPIDTPPPRVIAHRGESYLRTMAGTATVTYDPSPVGAPGAVEIWRYHAAGDRHLLVEKGRMLEGHAIPATHVQVHAHA